MAELKRVIKTGALKVPRPRPVLPQSATTYLSGVCQTASTHSHPVPQRGREKKDATKMNFSSCSDHSWIINDCYIFFPYLRVWVFLFLWTSFFTAQNVGPMVHVCRCLCNSSATGRLWHLMNFYAESNWFEFKVFLLQDSLPYQG